MISFAEIWCGPGSTHVPSPSACPRPPYVQDGRAPVFARRPEYAHAGALEFATARPGHHPAIRSPLKCLCASFPWFPCEPGQLGRRRRAPRLPMSLIAAETVPGRRVQGGWGWPRGGALCRQERPGESCRASSGSLRRFWRAPRTTNGAISRAGEGGAVGSAGEAVANRT